MFEICWTCNRRWTCYCPKREEERRGGAQTMWHETCDQWTPDRESEVRWLFLWAVILSTWVVLGGIGLFSLILGKW